MLGSDKDQSNAAWNPLAIALAAITAVSAVAIPLIPESLRPLNFALFGSLALFTATRGGRFGWLFATGFTLIAKLVCDLLNYINQNSDPDYLPIGIVYLALLTYVLVGWLFRQRKSLLMIPVSAMIGSSAFFLITNFHSWLRQDLPYGYNLTGLWECYLMAIPFHRWTFLSDLAGTVTLFAVYAICEQLLLRKLKTVPVSN